METPRDSSSRRSSPPWATAWRRNTGGRAFPARVSPRDLPLATLARNVGGLVANEKQSATDSRSRERNVNQSGRDRAQHEQRVWHEVCRSTPTRWPNSETRPYFLSGCYVRHPTTPRCGGRPCMSPRRVRFGCSRTSLRLRSKHRPLEQATQCEARRDVLQHPAKPARAQATTHLRSQQLLSDLSFTFRHPRTSSDDESRSRLRRGVVIAVEARSHSDRSSCTT